jgi:hypothetical protein
MNSNSNPKITQYKLIKSLDDKPVTNIDEFGLQKPQPYSLSNYTLNIDDSIIKSIGYGTIRSDFPLQLMDFERRKPREDDIVVQILYCGVCHSDWHTILNEWKNTKYPLIPGHEVSGKVIKIGSKFMFTMPPMYKRIC